MKKLIYILLLFSVGLNAQTLAFPTAMGAGAYTTGGRGQEVYHVTNLNATGAGSFRDALSQSNRTIVFDVSGVIQMIPEFQSTDILIEADNITVAGQTAPEGNITITGARLKFRGDNIIVRYLKFRSTDNVEGAISSDNGSDVIFDHLSVSSVESNQMAMSMVNNPAEIALNRTAQNCLVAYSGLGLIIGDTTPPNDTNNETYSVLNNAFVFTGHRIPAKVAGAVHMDIINNLSHGHQARLIRMDDWSYELNHIGNYYTQGRPMDQLHTAYYGTRNGLIYQDDNYYDPDFTQPDEWERFLGDEAPLPASKFVQSPFPYQNGETLNILSSSDLKTQMLPFVGCYKYIDDNGNVVENRDSIDTQAIDDALNETTRGNISEFMDITIGDIPTANNTRPVNFYNTNQHIPSAWLTANGYADTVNIHNQVELDGYTVLEKYINQVDGSGTGNNSPPLLLNNYPNASVAYSLDKINADYTGSAIRVRRSSDDAETDIGFVGDSLDTASLEAFCLGDELVTNGGFDTDSDWDKGDGWSISGGIASKTGAVLSYLTQTNLSSVVGKTYRVKASISNVTTGNVRIDNFTDGTVYTSSTEIDVIYTATSVGNFRFLGWNGFDGTIDNVSVKEVSDAFVTTWYDQSKGGVESPELVTNGSFDNDVSGWSASRNSVISFSTEKLRVTNGSGSTSGTADQQITTKVGSTYIISVDIGNFSPDLTRARVRIGTGAGLTGTAYYNNKMVFENTSITTSFVATSTVSYITVGLFGGQLSLDYAEFDNISVIEVLENNATQTTNVNQPQIVSNGSVILENGKPTIQFDGVDDYLEASSENVINTNHSIITVSKSTQGSLQGITSILDNFNDGVELTQLNGTSIRYALNDNDIDISKSIDSRNLLFANYDGSTQTFSLNSNAQTSSVSTSINTNNTTPLRISGRLDGNRINGNIQEIIIYDSDQSSNRQAIENDINGRYNIYAPPIINVTSVNVTPNSQSVEEGNTTQLSVEVLPNNADDTTGVWSTDNASIATVNQSGLVTAVSQGVANITFTSNDGSFTDSSAITVTAPSIINVTSVNVTPSTASVNVGQSTALTAEVLPSNATDKTGVWSSSNGSVATVDQLGVVRGLTSGTSTIAFTSNDGTFTDTCVVTVTEVSTPSPVSNSGLKSKKVKIILINN